MAHYDCDGCGAAVMGFYTDHSPGCPDDPANQIPYHKGEKIISETTIKLRSKKEVAIDRAEKKRIADQKNIDDSIDLLKKQIEDLEKVRPK